MSNVFPESLYGANTFADFMDKAEAATPPVEGAPAAATDGQAGGQAVPVAGESGAAATAGDGTTSTDASGAPAASAGQPGAQEPTGAAVPEPAGTPAGGYVPDPVWERSVVDTLGSASTAIVKKVQAEAQQEVVADLRQEYGQHFQLIEAPARMLIGKQVPSLDPEKDTEVLRDLADATDYQNATKQLLSREVNSRVQGKVQEQGSYLNVVGQSIDLLQANPDLLRDKELADRVAQLIAPYEYKKDGKLLGWSVDVKPLVGQVRTALAAERAARTTVPSPAPNSAPAASPPAPVEEPQAGIRSSAGQVADPDTFDQLWSTLGFNPGTISI